MSIRKVTNYNGQPHMDDLNDILKGVQELIDSGGQGEQGPAGEDGEDGTNGWSPILQLESDAERRVLRLIDWTGGTGTKPTLTGYLGTSGIVETPDLALNVRGTAGVDGIDGADGSDGIDGKSLEFNWDGTQLGIRQEGDTLYDYVDLKGEAGNDGSDGTNGADGADGVGVPVGGTAGQVLAKIDATDFNTEWITPTGGGGSGGAQVVSGSWTPRIVYNNAAAAYDHATGQKQAYYSRIDDMVYIYIRILSTTLAPASNSITAVIDLPFAPVYSGGNGEVLKADFFAGNNKQAQDAVTAGAVRLFGETDLINLTGESGIPCIRLNGKSSAFNTINLPIPSSGSGRILDFTINGWYHTEEEFPS